MNIKIKKYLKIRNFNKFFEFKIHDYSVDRKTSKSI